MEDLRVDFHSNCVPLDAKRSLFQARSDGGLVEWAPKSTYGFPGELLVPVFSIVATGFRAGPLV
jgi:hypothetical protein